MTERDSKRGGGADAGSRPSTAAVAVDVPEAVSVDIYDQIYHLRGTDPAHIERLAALVDEKMRAVAAYGLPDCLRMTVGVEEANRGVVAALAAFMAGGRS